MNYIKEKENIEMKILGITSTVLEGGQKSYTLHTAESFPAYANDISKGRSAEGQRVEAVYIGNYDCSNLKIGMEIEIYFDKAITTNKGTFQTVKKIEVLTTRKEL